MNEQALQTLQRDLLVQALFDVFGPIDRETLDELAQHVEWVHVRRGEALFRQGDPTDAFYVVASGRFQIVRETPNGEEIIAEVGRGECIGEMGFLSGMARTATPYAIRDSALCRIPGAQFENIVACKPHAMTTITRQTMRRLLGVAQPATRPACMNISVIPARPGAPSAQVARQLVQSLSRLGPTLHLTAQRVAEHLGPAALESADHPAWHVHSAWLDEQAAAHRFLVFEGEQRPTTWTRRALADADQVLLVAHGSSDPHPDALELELFDPKADPRHARRFLVLVHDANTTLPRGTARWLALRNVEQHLHVREGQTEPFDRLARTLAGAAISLVLGAGGARGFAHVGTLRALAEAGITIDAIGGTSCGAFAAGLYAMGKSPAEMMEFGRRMLNMRPFGDFTLPVTSMLHGRRIEQVTELAFGETSIEDLWLPYFCTTCDLSVFRDVVIDRGSLASAVLASSALPGVLPPRIHDGHLFVDGGTTDMLPGAVMRARTKGTMIAVDVSAEPEVVYPRTQYPTSWSALVERMNPFGQRILTASEIFWRAVSFGVSQRTAMVARDADLFLRPPVERFGTVEVGAMEVIERLGYEHARERLAQAWPPAPREDRRPVDLSR